MFQKYRPDDVIGIYFCDVRRAQESLNGDGDSPLRMLRVAVSIAKKYRGRGIPFEDLIQEANLAMLLAEREFDESKGLFGPFCVNKIYWHLKALMLEDRPIRIPYGAAKSTASPEVARDATRAMRVHRPQSWTRVRKYSPEKSRRIDELEQLENAIKNLGIGDQILIRAKESGKFNRIIAEERGVTTQTIQWHMARAIDRLREAFEKQA